MKWKRSDRLDVFSRRLRSITLKFDLPATGFFTLGENRNLNLNHNRTVPNDQGDVNPNAPSLKSDNPQSRRRQAQRTFDLLHPRVIALGARLMMMNGTARTPVITVNHKLPILLVEEEPSTDTK